MGFEGVITVLDPRQNLAVPRGRIAPIWGSANLLEKVSRDMWGITAIVSQYRTIWGHQVVAPRFGRYGLAQEKQSLLKWPILGSSMWIFLAINAAPRDHFMRKSRHFNRPLTSTLTDTLTDNSQIWLNRHPTDNELLWTIRCTWHLLGSSWTA